MSRDTSVQEMVQIASDEDMDRQLRSRMLNNLGVHLAHQEAQGPRGSGMIRLTCFPDPVNKEDCFRASVEFDPATEAAWLNLARALPVTQAVAPKGRYTVNVAGHGEMTKMDCYAKALALNAKRESAWAALGMALHQQTEQVRRTVIVGSRTVTAELCLAQALEIDPSYEGAWTALARILVDDKSVMINGESVTKSVCCQKATKLAMSKVLHGSKHKNQGYITVDP